MSQSLPEDVQQFVDRELASGRYHSADDLMVEGLRLLQREREEAVAGINEGLAEMDRGEGIPLDEAFDQLRRKHDIGPEI